MNILGIDYGLKKVGLAIATGSLADPLLVLRYSDIRILEKEIAKICEKERIEKIVVGISEGQMAKKTKEFIKDLENQISIPIVKFDETLSTQDAQRLSIESGMRRSKRKEMEDAIAAAVMLQNYLDERQ